MFEVGAERAGQELCEECSFCSSSCLGDSFLLSPRDAVLFSAAEVSEHFKS